jgi:signal transduction histidine kinase
MPKPVKSPSQEKFGVIIILASLAVIGFILAVLVNTQLEARVSELRSRGVNLVRLLAETPYAQLASEVPRRGPLHLIYESANDGQLAYAAVTDRGGQPQTQIAAPGVIIPGIQPGATPSEWLGERTLSIDAAREIMEFYAPLLVNGDLAGHVRLGYFKPVMGLDRTQVSFLATVSLPIFLLVPLFYFLLRREVRPLREANTEIQSLIDSRALNTVDIRASGELGDFLARFNSFVEFMRTRVDTLEGEQSRLVTSSKLLTYQRMRVETVLQAFPEAILVMDDTGSINYANMRLANLLGRQVDDIVATKPAQWCDDEKLREYLSQLRAKSSHGYAGNSLELSLPNAVNKTIHVHNYPLFSPRESAEILGTLVVFRDVTEEVLAKRARGEFVAHVAHELKTPLNVLAMYAEALQGEDGNSEDFRIEAVNVIGDEVARLSGLINNLLSITKIEMGHLKVDKQRVKLRELLQDAFENVSRSGRDAHLNFKLELPGEISPVSIDKELLRISINNLLTNAIKYNNPNGTVTLKAEETDAAILVSVKDDGIGISSEDQKNIFSKFYRSDDDEVRSRTGHGLGLALAQDIVHLHHGELHVVSEPGEGSEFTIELKKDSGLLQKAI